MFNLALRLAGQGSPGRAQCHSSLARPGGRLDLAAALLSLASLSACSGPDLQVAGGGDDEGSTDASVVTRDAGSTRDSGRASSKDAGKPVVSQPTGEGTTNACAKAELTTTRTVPTVWLLVDGSGSMAAPLSGLTGPSRFHLLRDALMAQGSGLVARLQGSVAFGLLIYDGGLSPPGIPTPLCPRVIAVEPALDNFATLDLAYPAVETGASTPTHYALTDLAKRIAAAPNAGPDHPTYVVLATDGKPNLCDFHDGIPASVLTEQEAVDTVSTLAESGTKLFAISLAGDDLELQAHLDAVARAGNTGKSAFSPTTQDALVDALSEIIGGTTSCEVRVEGTIVKGRECAGDVRLDGAPLVCNGDDGFRVATHGKGIELLGAACKTLQQKPSVKVSASFACDDVILL